MNSHEIKAELDREIEREREGKTIYTHRGLVKKHVDGPHFTFTLCQMYIRIYIYNMYKCVCALNDCFRLAIVALAHKPITMQQNPKHLISYRFH